jgi:phage terminase large subunit-like protein
MTIFEKSWDDLTDLQKEYLLTIRLIEREKKHKIQFYYPELGPLRRELYVKHMEFFAAGTDFNERLMLAANRVGKTEGVGGYETTLHLTGRYPDWWVGRRFERPVSAWAAGDTGETVRDIIQFKMLGPVGEHGTGLIPHKYIKRTTPRSGLPDAVKDVYIKHSSGGTSHLAFKSYDQKRISFQGTEKELIWLDEEPPMPVYTECLLRTMTTKQGMGMLMNTFTPLLGLSEVVLSFLPGGKLPD